MPPFAVRTVCRCLCGGGYWYGLRPNKQKKSVDPKGFLVMRDGIESAVDVTGNRG